MRRRAAITLALLTALAWCLLLFGIGLDDLTNGDTKTGVIFSIVVLVVMIAGLCYGIWRIVRTRVRHFVAHR
jgi:hypothetical protein